MSPNHVRYKRKRDEESAEHKDMYTDVGAHGDSRPLYKKHRPNEFHSLETDSANTDEEQQNDNKSDGQSLSQMTQTNIEHPICLWTADNKQEAMNQLLVRMQDIEQYYNDTKEPIFDSPSTVLRTITRFLNLGVMTRGEFLRHIGNIPAHRLSEFYRTSNCPLVYEKAYHWLEKLRLSQGLYKTEERLKNEQLFPNGFNLSAMQRQQQQQQHEVNADDDNKTQTNKEKWQCFKCGKYGHSVRDCSNPLSNARPRRPDTFYRQYGTECRHCRQTGHWKSECPKLRQKNPFDLFAANSRSRRQIAESSTNDSNENRSKEIQTENVGTGKNGDCGHIASETQQIRRLIVGHSEKEKAMNAERAKSPEMRNSKRERPILAVMCHGDKCKKCGQYGHWQRECTSNKSNVCFHCGLEGHWARNCPDAKTRRRRFRVSAACNINEATVNTQRSIQKDDRNEEKQLQLNKSNVCFHCHQSGHWARNCPNKTFSTYF